MTLNNKRIFITGATGFVGSNMARELAAKNAQVAISVRTDPNTWRINDILEKLAVFKFDLLNKAEVENSMKIFNPEIIIHTACYGGHIFQSNSTRIFDTNFMATVNLLEACRKIDYELFINTGSSSEYGVKNKVMKEGDIPEPITDYGVAKAAATLYCQACAKREKKPIVTLRLFSPYGFYDDLSRLIPFIINNCISNVNPGLSEPESVRDYVFIEDVKAAYIDTINNKDNVSGEIINISSGIQSSVAEVVENIIGIIGGTVTPEWGRVKNTRIEPKMWKGDNSKARDLIGWVPRYNLSQGLSETVEWFKDNVSLYC